jgi:tape measure domain-containing protein
MPSVDDRIVRIDFDNASFERKIDTTLKSLAQLNEALKLEGAGKGLAGIDQAAKSSGGSLAHIAEGVDHIASRFSAMGAVAFSVISNITSGALGMVKKLGGDILAPIITGGKQRALNIEQAKFMFQGLGVDVEKAMASSKKAVLGTAYGLDEAAKAAAQFSASGVDAGDQMYHTLEGVAGIAAMTNSSFSEIADVFTAAAGQGKISGYTLERISYRGLNAAAAFAKQTGKTEAEVRKMASEGKISFTEFASAMDKAFGAHAQEANKTYTGSLSNLHAAMSRLGAAVWTPQLEQQRDLFNALTPTLDKIKEALTPVIDMFTLLTRINMTRLVKAIDSISFKDLTKAMPLVAKSMYNIWALLQQIKKIAGQAFKDIFPPGMGNTLTKIAQAFLDFTNKLKIGGQFAAQLRSIFRGFFAILSIGWTVIKEGVKFLAGLVDALLGLSGGTIMSGLASIGDFFTNLQKSLVKGKGIHNFFAVLTDLIKAPIAYLKDLKDGIASFFDGFDKAKAASVEKLTGRVEDRFASLHRLMERLGEIWRPLSTAFDRVHSVLSAIWNYIKDFFTQLGHNIAEVLGHGTFNDALDALNTALLGGITALLYKFIHGGLKIDLSGGLFDHISGMFDQLTGTLQAMQTQIKAEALMKIATAIAILTASVVVLSLIDSAALTKALTAMAVGFGQLMGAFALIDKMSSGTKGAVQFDLIAGGMIALATAMVILSGAVAILGSMDWGTLMRGLVGVTLLLTIISVAVIPLSRQGPKLIVAGAGLIAIGVGLNILGAAVKIFASMNWGEMAKGLIGVGAALLIVGVAAKTMPANMPITGAGLILVGIGLNILAGAIAMFGTMEWGTLGKGLLGVAGGLVVIAAAMQLMPITLPITGAGLILVGIGLTGVAGALKMMGSMNWSQIGKGLAAMAGALIILAVATNAMSGAIGGAIAIGIVAVSLGVLADVLVQMSGLSWGDLLHGLIAIAAALAVLALAALAMEPAIPAMLGMGAALMLIGASFALVGAGVFLVAKGFETLAKSGEAGAKSIVKMLETLGKAIPKLAMALATGLLEFITEFAKGLPVLVAAIGEFLQLLLVELTKLLPKIGEFLVALLETLWTIIKAQAQNLIDAGIFIITTLLQGIRDNLPQIIILVGDIITEFLDGMGTQIPRILTSLTNMFINILISLAENLGRASFTLSIGIAIAFLRGFIQGLQQQAPFLKAWFVDLPLKILAWLGNVAMTLFRKGWDLLNGLWNGLKSLVGAISGWLGGIPGKIVGWIGGGLTTLFQKGSDLIQGFFNGLLNIWRTVVDWASGLMGQILGWIPNPLTLLSDIGSKIMDGLKDGIVKGFEKVKDFVGGIGSKIVSLKGPPEDDAKLLIDNGKLIMQSLQVGLEKGWGETAQWIDNLDVSKQFDAIVSQVNDSMAAIESAQPVITPVLDLTQVAADASLVSDMIQKSPGMPATFSIAQANTIAASTNAAQAAPAMEPTSATGEGIKFEQNIYAPEQLSTADIYKNTRNQITIAKEELNIR